MSVILHSRTRSKQLECDSGFAPAEWPITHAHSFLRRGSRDLGLSFNLYVFFSHSSGGTQFCYSEVSMIMCFGGGTKYHRVIFVPHAPSLVLIFPFGCSPRTLPRHKDFTVGSLMRHLFYFQISVLQVRYICVRNFSIIDAEQPQRDLPVPM